MGIEFGSLADWVSGIGGFLAAAAAVVAWRVNKRMLEVEERRDAAADDRTRQAERRREREQASLIFALGARLPGRSDEEEWAIFLYNGSTRPVFEVTVFTQRGNTQGHTLKLGALPPGQFIVPSHSQFHWGSLIDLSLAPEEVNLLVKGSGMKMITRLEFRDAGNLSWVLAEGTELQPQEVHGGSTKLTQ